jgi:hypothetical protein
MYPRFAIRKPMPTINMTTATHPLEPTDFIFSAIVDPAAAGAAAGADAGADPFLGAGPGADPVADISISLGAFYAAPVNKRNSGGGISDIRGSTLIKSSMAIVATKNTCKIKLFTMSE